MPIDPEKGTVILAAHGSRREPVANAVVQEHARRLQKEYGCGTVKTAFRQGTPTFGEVLDSLSVDEVTVVPFVAADGYYARTVLPRELSLNQRYPQMRVRFTKAVGNHPRIPPLVNQRVRQLKRQFHLSAEQTALIVVGHGTRRHALSSASTRALVEELRKFGVCSEVHPAFLDEPPQLEEVFRALSRPQVVVLPFFMGSSYHVLQDLPRRLGMENLVGTPFPAQATRAGQQVVFDRALQGKLVVRLKGGDPFVFGRGGEEQNACQKAGVHCVVVPGVSSALAAPASVGIPVTYRQKSRHFVVVTGHSNGEGDPLDYSALASIDTIVILMGRSNLVEFCELLMTAGKDPTTPAACVEWATTQKQKLSTGSLQSIAALVERDKLQPPVVTIVGEVAALAATSDSFARECWQLADPAHRGDHPWLS